MAYAAVISLLQLVDSIRHPSASGWRVYFNRTQLKSFHQKVSFLEDFLESSSSQRKDPELESLERKIRYGAYKAEDIIASEISNQLLAEKKVADFQCMPVIVFYLGSKLDRILELFDVVFLVFQKVISLWIQILIPVMCSVIPISVQSFLTVSFQNVIFVWDWTLFLIYVPFMLIIMAAAGAECVMYRAVLKGRFFGARCWLYVSQPENQDLGRAMDDISFIMEEVIKIKDACNDSGQSVDDSADGLSRRDFRDIGRNAVVGLDSDLNEIYARLIGYPSELQILSIVGMGGIGKTTLARQVHDGIKAYHFDICAWVTVSQKYSLRCVMLSLLDSAKVGTEEILKNHKECDGDLDQKLGRHLYQNLMGRRYLIVMDDVWDTEIWDLVRIFFPDNNNGSRVLLTTRLSEVASYAHSAGSPSIQMRFLNDGDSWNLLCEKVFGGEGCPPKLEAIGRTIARNCRGLPLAIVVVGGLLYNERRTVRDWRRVSENLNSILSRGDDQCLELLGLSYKQLPHRLKPCFLYMGAFPEDREICVTKLFQLWGAEGFLEPSKSKSLEEVAEEYLKDLMQRNLIMAGKWRCNGTIRTCKIHDLLREVCLLNAEKDNFLNLGNRNGPENSSADKVGADSRGSYCMARSFICFGGDYVDLQQFYSGFRLLRVLDLVAKYLDYFPYEIVELFHLRYLGIRCGSSFLTPSISGLSNLQTFVFHGPSSGVWGIWRIPNLRHLYFMKDYLHYPGDYHNSSVLENLQTLVGISYFKCTKDVLKRIPNLKKLGISYSVRCSEDWSPYELESLINLHQLENLKIAVGYKPTSALVHPPKLAFPEKLKKLSLSGCRIPWESMKIVGALPNLQVLKLRNYAFQGQNWEPVEGEFCRLMFLLIDRTDLVQWKSNETHFPHLQRLILRRCKQLEEIPCGIGDIPTLERIELVDCHPSAMASAREIQEEQQSMGNEGLKIHIEIEPPMRWWTDIDDILGNLETQRSRTRPPKRKRKINKGKRIFF